MKCQTCDSTTPHRVCNSCQTKTHNRLTEIPTLQTILAADPWIKLPKQADSERPTKTTTTGAPADLHILTLLDRRTDARAHLTPHLQAIQQQMNATPTTPPDTATTCSQLQKLLPWATTSYTEIATLITEIHKQHNLLDRAITGHHQKPKAIPCPVIHPDTGQCTGKLRMSPDLTITCNNCKSTWNYDLWARLARLLA